MAFTCARRRSAYRPLFQWRRPWLRRHADARSAALRPISDATDSCLRAAFNAMAAAWAPRSTAATVRSIGVGSSISASRLSAVSRAEGSRHVGGSWVRTELEME